MERTNTDDIELEAALKELPLNLGGNAVETDMALGEDRLRRVSVHGGSHENERECNAIQSR